MGLAERNLLGPRRITLPQFAAAQFHNPRMVGGLRCLLVSWDGKYALAAKENQAKYHPAQRCSAHALSDDTVVEALDELDRLSGEEEAARWQQIQLWALGPLEMPPKPAVVVRVPPVSSEHSALVAHAMDLRLFMLAKFHNPKALEAFDVMFVSSQMASAETAKENQGRYHPVQGCTAHDLGHGAVADALLEMERVWGPEDQARLEELLGFATGRHPEADPAPLLTAAGSLAVARESHRPPNARTPKASQRQEPAPHGSPPGSAQNPHPAPSPSSAPGSPPAAAAAAAGFAGPATARKGRTGRRPRRPTRCRKPRVARRATAGSRWRRGHGANRAPGPWPPTRDSQRQRVAPGGLGGARVRRQRGAWAPRGSATPHRRAHAAAPAAPAASVLGRAPPRGRPAGQPPPREATQHGSPSRGRLGRKGRRATRCGLRAIAVAELRGASSGGARVDARGRPRPKRPRGARGARGVEWPTPAAGQSTRAWPRLDLGVGLAPVPPVVWSKPEARRGHRVAVAGAVDQSRLEGLLELAGGLFEARIARDGRPGAPEGPNRRARFDARLELLDPRLDSVLAAHEFIEVRGPRPGRRSVGRKGGVPLGRQARLLTCPHLTCDLTVQRFPFHAQARTLGFEAGQVCRTLCPYGLRPLGRPLAALLRGRRQRTRVRGVLARHLGGGRLGGGEAVSTSRVGKGRALGDAEGPRVPSVCTPAPPRELKASPGGRTRARAKRRSCPALTARAAPDQRIAHPRPVGPVGQG
mmetsp:Transcript_32183/g.72613  ORF Transcript_32183/g.72613 Transcript_32183/m.72613 type:complete len:756 (+) Transcript_32183:2633-4900(+)